MWRNMGITGVIIYATFAFDLCQLLGALVRFSLRVKLLR
jgi:hypothetical protein